MNFKIAAITGHTKGIGQALFLKLCKNKEVLGFSRSNGFDISDELIVDSIIQKTANVPVFINNAYHGKRQNLIAQKWLAAHRDKQHLLINISSLAATFETTFGYDKEHPLYEYAKNKQDLEKESLRANLSLTYPKVITISFAIVDTDFYLTPKNLLEKTRRNKSIISADDAAGIILKAIEEYDKPWFKSHYIVMNHEVYFKDFSG